MAMYESDHTKFMREWMEKHPDQRDEQKKGRALWWDKPQSVEEQKRVAAVRVPVKPYYYDINN
ncbi:MAG: DUF3460 family protein [Thauera sp.]|nr:DUF3460 family protein [Thauera sp.]